MAFQFDKTKTMARVAPSTTKEAIVDLETALKYVNERVKEFEKENWDGCPWLKKGSTQKDEYIVEVNLFNMPLYWSYEPIGKKVQIKNPDLTPLREIDAMLGEPMYGPVTKEEGVELIRALAGGENDDLNEILERGAKALPFVLNEELPNITKRAVVVYNERGHEKTHGAFGEANVMGDNDRKVISKEKQNAMNSAKQKARSDLGYTRARMTPKGKPVI